jgi:septum formation protein
VSTFEEDLSHSSFPAAADYAVETARHKAVDVARICASRPGPPVSLIISADTVRRGLS